MTNEQFDSEKVREEMENRMEGTWFCALTQFSINEDGRLCLLVLEYDPNDGSAKTIRIPGGSTKRARGDRTPEGTLRAEAAEEIFAGDGHISDFVPFYRHEMPNKAGHEAHVKYFSLAMLEGDSRTSRLSEDETVDESGKEHYEVLGPPMFVPIGELVGDVRVRGWHLKAIHALLAVASGREKNKEVVGMLSKALESPALSRLDIGGQIERAFQVAHDRVAQSDRDRDRYLRS